VLPRHRPGSSRLILSQVPPIGGPVGQFRYEPEYHRAGGTLIPLIYSIALTNDPSGRLRGSGTAIVQVGEDFVAAFYTASGSVTGAA